MSTRRIDSTRYNAVLWSRVCPGCGEYRVVDVVRRSRKDALDQKGSKFLGAFHACGGPDGHRCWNMTRYEEGKPDKPLYESFGEAEDP